MPTIVTNLLHPLCGQTVIGSCVPKRSGSPYTTSPGVTGAAEALEHRGVTSQHLHGPWSPPAMFHRGVHGESPPHMGHGEWEGPKGNQAADMCSAHCVVWGGRRTPWLCSVSISVAASFCDNWLRTPRQPEGFPRKTFWIGAWHFSSEKHIIYIKKI